MLSEIEHRMRFVCDSGSRLVRIQTLARQFRDFNNDRHTIGIIENKASHELVEALEKAERLLVYLSDTIRETIPEKLRA